VLKLGRLFRPDPVRQGQAERIKAAVRMALGLGEEHTVSVNEIECGDPACPGGVETVILVRGRASVTKAVKLPGEMAMQTEAAVRDALADVPPRS
jgi:hypothetical protein